MPETENDKGETLNDVSNLESTTSGLDYSYKTSNDAGRLYKNLINIHIQNQIHNQNYM